MPNFNKIILIGHLTRDPEMKYSQTGLAICRIGIAVNKKYKGEEKAMFIDVTAFGKTAELIAERFFRGDPIGIDGELQYESWEKDGVRKSKHSVICNNMFFVGSSQKNDRGNYDNTREERAKEGQEHTKDRDEIPF